MNFYNFLAVGLGGFLGTVARYAAVKSVDEKINAVFPYGTFAVNVIGSLLLGIIYTAALRKVGMTENWRLFLGVGFCGGFTTFSAFAWENFSLIQQKFMGTSLAYALASLGVGLLALMAGVWIGRFL
ncbi:MAG: fluoride efflux transporter CrcB [Cyclobacteriaceae bacterium]|jgi:CrcB protein|nr:fluoride efflux transporter CrcB [Cyclobacteriaceae bacterium]MDH4297640.1 fluoride efflux transporter CrcB [Cyclobacteriaceae bacterium]MDH5250696.1 fluoride efflux transporter CrcB [Cyclobacteriaceae bacterium]